MTKEEGNHENHERVVTKKLMSSREHFREDEVVSDASMAPERTNKSEGVWNPFCSE